jgi:hypothetical protein
LRSFTGVTTSDGVELSWTTVTEKDNASFTVERSAEGKDFEILKEVPGSGTSFVERKYTAIDRTPLEGIGYYRLKQTNVDRSFTYSNIIAVTSEGIFPTIKVFPNPASDILSIQLKGKWIAPQMRIFNASGQLIFDAPAAGDNAPVDVNVAELPKGLYFLVIGNGVITRTEKFVVH